MNHMKASSSNNLTASFDFYDLTPAKEGTDITDAFEFARDMCEFGKRPPLNAHGALWFRGQADASWKLVPKIARSFEYWGKEHSLTPGKERNVEYRLLHNFRRIAHAHYKRELSLWESITLAQHHGLPTRLLDWTASPMVALYFAVSDRVSGRESTDGAVYFFRLRTSVEHLSTYISNFSNPDASGRPEHYPDPMTIEGIKIVYPMMSTERLIAQSGAFTIQDLRYSMEEQSFREMCGSQLDLFDLWKLRVPRSSKPRILQQLERVAINRKTLFPDLDGLGIGLLHSEMLRSKVEDDRRG